MSELIVWMILVALCIAFVIAVLAAMVGAAGS